MKKYTPHMNKLALAGEMAEAFGYTAKQASRHLDEVFDTILRVLVSGKSKKISITGVGVFEVVERAGRWARNPKTGDRIWVEPTTTLVYRPGQSVKDMVTGVKPLPADRSAAMKSPKTSKAAPASDAA